MSSNKWEVRIQVDEELIREYHEQAPEDPDTDESDARDAIRELLEEGVRAVFDDAFAKAATDGAFTVLDAHRA